MIGVLVNPTIQVTDIYKRDIILNKLATIFPNEHFEFGYILDYMEEADYLCEIDLSTEFGYNVYILQKSGLIYASPVDTVYIKGDV
jgi:hypothetical protein